MATVSRSLAPSLIEFLYDLSASDGADQTRVVDAGGAADRKGEPFGELGLVKKGDFAWGDQTGSPADPQPGNVGGGARDVLRTADDSASSGGGGSTGGNGNARGNGKGKAKGNSK